MFSAGRLSPCTTVDYFRCVKSTIEEVLTPMKASALYVGMHYAKPLALFEAMGVSAERLADFSNAFMSHLTAPLGSRA